MHRICQLASIPLAAALLGACAAPQATAPVTPPAANTISSAPAAPPPAWQQGRTASMASSSLSPVAGKLTATAAADIPISKLKLPPSFKAEIWVSGMPGARAIVQGDNGKYYVGTRGIGRVYEITDAGGARSNRVVVDKLNQPAGIEFQNGSLT